MTLAVGWVDPGTVRGEFTESVTQLVAYETWHQRLGSVIRTHSGPLLVEGRNLLVEKFLKTDCDWLLMVDTDMTFPYQAAEQLLDTADPERAPVVGGLCYGISKELGPFPTVYQRPRRDTGGCDGCCVHADASGDLRHVPAGRIPSVVPPPLRAVQRRPPRRLVG